MPLIKVPSYRRANAVRLRCGSSTRRPVDQLSEKAIKSHRRRMRSTYTSRAARIFNKLIHSTLKQPRCLKIHAMRMKTKTTYDCSPFMLSTNVYYYWANRPMSVRRKWILHQKHVHAHFFCRAHAHPWIIGWRCCKNTADFCNLRRVIAGYGLIAAHFRLSRLNHGLFCALGLRLASYCHEDWEIGERKNGFSQDWSGKMEFFLSKSYKLIEPLFAALEKVRFFCIYCDGCASTMVVRVVSSSCSAAAIEKSWVVNSNNKKCRKYTQCFVIVALFPCPSHISLYHQSHIHCSHVKLWVTSAKSHLKRREIEFGSIATVPCTSGPNDVVKISTQS